MGRHTKTEALLAAAIEVLSENHPMTVRQVFYQLVSRQVLENTLSRYKAVSDLLADARKEGVIPWARIEDRMRQPRAVPMWDGLRAFGETVRRSYRRDVWADQPRYVEVWLEKDALSGIFEDVLNSYGMTLNVGRGYDGWDSIHSASERYLDYELQGCSVVVLYFGDFDPSGEDMVRSLRKRLAELDCEPEIVKCALTADDIARYNLPPNFTKPTDSRAAAFVRKHGDVAVELDALPVDVLRERLRGEVEARMDMSALAATRLQEQNDRERLVGLLARADW